MTTVLLPPTDHCDDANLFVSTFSANNAWFFVGDHTDHVSLTVASVNTDVESTFTNPWTQMIMGKKLSSTNVKRAIRNIPYQTNKAFAMYDDQDSTMFDDDYYCVVNAGAYSHVFLCLDNAGDSNSTVQPDFAQITGANVTIYETADNYRWKYMYSVDATTISNFATSDYFPFVANSSTNTTAVNGSLNIFKVTGAGKLYNNYTFGSFTTSDLRVNSDQTLYLLSNSAVSTTNGYYTGCIIYLTGGVGVNQYKTVTDYVCNTSGNYIKLDSAFSIAPLNGTQFEIYPSIQVVGTGVQTVNCIARAIIDPLLSNSVSKIEVLVAGQDYTTATASVVANSSVGVTLPATIRPIIPPPGGHGFKQDDELDAHYVVISQTLSNSESNTIPTSNKFQQIGILRNPIWSYAQLTLSSPTNYFIASEIAYMVSPVTVAINCSANSSTTIITGDTKTDFVNQFSPGDYVIVTDKVTNYSLAKVSVATNSSSLTLTSNSLFSGNTLFLMYPNISANLTISDVSSETSILVSSIQGDFTTGAQLIGSVSGAYATVSAISINNVTKGFNTFIQLNKYTISMIAGAFAANEIVAQGSTTALVHSVDGTDLYVSNQTNVFQTGIVHLIGQSTGAIASVQKAYPLELQYGQGDIVYLENIAAITRQPNQTETFKIIKIF